MLRLLLGIYAFSETNPLGAGFPVSKAGLVLWGELKRTEPGDVWPMVSSA